MKTRVINFTIKLCSLFFLSLTSCSSEQKEVFELKDIEETFYLRENGAIGVLKLKNEIYPLTECKYRLDSVNNNVIEISTPIGFNRYIIQLYVNSDKSYEVVMISESDIKQDEWQLKFDSERLILNKYSPENKRPIRGYLEIQSDDVTANVLFSVWASEKDASPL